MTQSINRETILRTLSLLHGENDVIEVRAFDAAFRNNGQRKPAVISGYFNDREKLVAELDRLADWKGVSVNLNRLAPECASRVTNQLNYLPKGGGVTDNDIDRIRWLPVDIDVHVEGPTPASEDEHKLALLHAHRVAAECGKLGWPQPIIGDSGNGMWVLFPVDLDPSEKVFARKAAERIGKQFREDGLKIDTAVANPGRLVKLFGTINRKGEERAEDGRTHRLSCLRSIGQQEVRLTAEKLAEFVPSAQQAARLRRPTRRKIDVAQLIATHGWSVEPSKQVDDRTVWQFLQSPMCDHHDGRPYIQQFENGAISAGCLHGGCNWGWKELRERYGIPETDAELSGDAIFVDHEQHRVVAETIERLANHPDIYVRGGKLCTVSKDHYEDKRSNVPAGVPTCMDLPGPRLQGYISERCQYFKLDANNRPKLTHVPGFVVSMVTHEGSWHGINRLTYVSKCPLVRPDGSLLDEAGYDADTGIRYDPCGDVYPCIPDAPTRDDAIASRDALLELVCDFPFVSDVYKSAWLAALLTMPADLLTEHARPPLILSNAGNASVGKSKLLELIGEIALGGPLPTATFSSEHAEMRKVIASYALKGVRAIFFDNVVRGGSIESPPLNAAITSTVLGERLLGTNDAPDLPLQFMTLVSGNNLTTTTEVGRRTLLIRLDAEDDHPELRNNFRIPNLIGHVQQHRCELYMHILTILRAWHCAGRPTQSLRAWGSFERWSSVIRQAIVWLDLPDPMDGSLELTEGGEDNSEAEIIIDAVAYACEAVTGAKQEGITAVGLLEQAMVDNKPQLAALLALFKNPNVKQLGRKLADYKNTRVPGGRMLRVWKDRNKTNRFAVENCREPSSTT